MARSGNALLNESTRLQLAVTQDRLAWIVFVMSKSIGNRNPLQTLDDQVKRREKKKREIDTILEYSHAKK